MGPWTLGDAEGLLFLIRFGEVGGFELSDEATESMKRVGDACERGGMVGSLEKGGDDDETS